MHQVQLEENDLLTSLAAEAQGGEIVTLVRNGHPVAQIIPLPMQERSRAERMAALDQLDALMEKGYDMGLIWNGRDELYDRDE